MASREVEALTVAAALFAALLLPSVSSQIIFPVSGCKDANARCSAQALAGSCTSNPTFMRNVCPLSCNLCLTTTTTTTTTTTSQADTTTMSPEKPTSTPNPDIETTNVPRRSIVNPDFECGGPTSSPHSRTARQAPVHELQAPNSPFAVLAGDGVQPLRHTSCGASPISDRFLLTAAYCVVDPNHAVTSVRLGDIDLAQRNENNSKPADYAIVAIFLPDTFVDGNGYDDIALLQTDRKIEFSDVVFPYCLSSTPPAAGTEVIAAGFGHINETHKSSHLMEATLRVMPMAQCEDRYLQHEEQRLKATYPSLLQGKKGLLCAGDEHSGVCKGDEGGPLFREDKDGRRFLEGITSFSGSHCGEGVLPGVFTAVADYVDFIDETIYGKQP